MYSLEKYNTFGVQAFAKELMFIEHQEDLMSLVENGVQADLILGGGSNVLFAGDELDLVLKNNILGKKILSDSNGEVLIEVGGGENWHELVMWTLDQNLSGIENLSLIPGTAGAAPIQNIGAYGVELKDVFYSLDALDLKTNTLKVFYPKDCEFAYRNSLFKKEKGRYFILKVRLKLNRNGEVNISYGTIAKVLAEKGIKNPDSRAVSDVVISIRSAKLPDPELLNNAGSFFKNPIISKESFSILQKAHPKIVYYPAEDGIKIPAGWLIEQCGFKGKREGAVGCYAKQALVIVNYGGASGEEVIAWAEKIEKSVLEQFNISLEREVNVI